MKKGIVFLFVASLFFIDLAAMKSHVVIGKNEKDLMTNFLRLLEKNEGDLKKMDTNKIVELAKEFSESHEAFGLFKEYKELAKPKNLKPFVDNVDNINNMLESSEFKNAIELFVDESVINRFFKKIKELLSVKDTCSCVRLMTGLSVFGALAMITAPGGLGALEELYGTTCPTLDKIIDKIINLGLMPGGAAIPASFFIYALLNFIHGYKSGLFDSSERGAALGVLYVIGCIEVVGLTAVSLFLLKPQISKALVRCSEALFVRKAVGRRKVSSENVRNVTLYTLAFLSVFYVLHVVNTASD